MWRIAVALLYVLAVDSRPMDSLEDPLWQQNFIQTLKNHPKFLTQRSFSQDAPYDTDNMNLELPISRLPRQDKRALAMIARWGPFANIGKQRTPIRNNYIDPEVQINTQTRARGPGQPLRWG